MQEHQSREHIILNTDAGIVLSKKNRDFIKNHDYVVYVNVGLEVQLERLSMHTSSLLAQSDLKSLLTTIHERDSLFQEVADIEVNTENGTVDSHVMSVIEGAHLENAISEENAVNINEFDLVHLHNVTHKPTRLSEQQAIVLKLLAHGKSAKEIARDLNISPRTVEGHIANIKDSLGCSSGIELISLYLKRI